MKTELPNNQTATDHLLISHNLFKKIDKQRYRHKDILTDKTTDPERKTPRKTDTQNNRLTER